MELSVIVRRLICAVAAVVALLGEAQPVFAQFAVARLGGAIRR